MPNSNHEVHVQVLVQISRIALAEAHGNTSGPSQLCRESEVAQPCRDIASAAARVVACMAPEQRQAASQEIMLTPGHLIDQICKDCSKTLCASHRMHLASLNLHYLAAFLSALSVAAIEESSMASHLLDLVGHLLPLAQQVASCALAREASVADAACALLKALLAGAGPKAPHLVAHVAPVVQHLFASSGSAECLDVVTKLAEEAGSADEVAEHSASPHVPAQAVATVDACLKMVQSGPNAQSLQAQPAVVSGALRMLCASTQALPHLFLAAGAVEPLLAFGLQALEAHALDGAEGALRLLCCIIMPNDLQQERCRRHSVCLAAAQEALRVCMHRIVCALLRTLLRRRAGQDASANVVAALLSSMLARHRAEACAALQDVLVDRHAGVVSGTVLSHQDRVTVVRLLTCQPCLPQRRIVAVLKDVSAMAQGVGHAGTLMAYQLPPAQNQQLSAVIEL